MGEIWTWIMMIGFVLAAGIILYLFAAIPMMYFQKKEISAFKKLGEMLNFEINAGRVKLAPNFPVIKGYIGKRFFVVSKAADGKGRRYNSYSKRSSSRTKWILKISTKIHIAQNLSMELMSFNNFKEPISPAEFGKYFKTRISSQDLNINFSDELKKDLIQLYLDTGIYIMKLKKQVLYTSNYHGLINDKDVEHCKKKLEVLAKLADHFEGNMGVRA